MRKGYFTPPVLIILAIIIFAVAILIAINTDLVKRIKKEPTPTPITSPSPTTQQPSPTPDETAIQMLKRYADISKTAAKATKKAKSGNFKEAIKLYRQYANKFSPYNMTRENNIIKQINELIGQESASGSKLKVFARFGIAHEGLYERLSDQILNNITLEKEFDFAPIIFSPDIQNEQKLRQGDTLTAQDLAYGLMDLLTAEIAPHWAADAKISQKDLREIRHRFITRLTLDEIKQLIRSLPKHDFEQTVTSLLLLRN